MLKKISFIITCILFINCYAKTQDQKVDIKKLSEAIGHIIGKNLDDFGFDLDLKRMIKGIKKGCKNKSCPMTEDECLQALAILQIKANEKICEENLKEAENFLKNNLQTKDVIELEKNKLQYKILKKGEGSSIKSYNYPIVKLTGKYLDGKIFTNVEEVVNLNETLPALKKALIGMKLKEKRQVFIHPEIAFGKNAPGLNSLVIFDVEVIDVEATNKNPLDEIADTKVF